MGEWSNTTYVQHGELDVVENALIELFREEGRHLIPKPPEREYAGYEPMHYERAAGNDLWALALLPGRDGWTIVRTTPFDLFCERAAGADRLRLASLAERIGCNTLTYNMYDSTGGILLEATRTGDYALSGFTRNPVHEGASMGYYDEPFGGDQHVQAYFRLLDPDTLLDGCDDPACVDVIDQLRRNPYPKIRTEPMPEVITHALANCLGGPNAEGGHNSILVHVLIPNKELHIPGGRSLYFERA